MARVCTYLNFRRNTEEVFNFYKSVFGGEFSGTGISRMSEVPAVKSLWSSRICSGEAITEAVLISTVFSGCSAAMKSKKQYNYDGQFKDPDHSQDFGQGTGRKVWKHWTTPGSIKLWNNASADWHTPSATNDLRKNGKFSYRMEARDGSSGFDFWGIYDNIDEFKKIDYTLGDNRRVRVTFSSDGKTTKVTESFEAESTNPVEMQRRGWQSILDNFKAYTESVE